MAFEDRSSPNTATSPVPGSSSSSNSSSSSGTGSPLSSTNDLSTKHDNNNPPNSPESTRTCVQECTTTTTTSPRKLSINLEHNHHHHTFFRIADYISISDTRKTVECDRRSCSPISESNRSSQRSLSPTDSVTSSNYSSLPQSPIGIPQSLLQPPVQPIPPGPPVPPGPPAPPLQLPQPQQLHNQNDENELRPEPLINTLRYSIANILQPDFGKLALKQKCNQKISTQPYEVPSTVPEPKPLTLYNLATAPLGSLCQTVSQIGCRTLSGRRLSASSSSTTTSSSSSSSASSALSSLTTGSLLIRPTEDILERSKSIKSTVTATATSSTILPNPEEVKKNDSNPVTSWPAWVYCTRYSDRPSSGPRSRRIKKPPSTKSQDDKRPRTAFTTAQLARLKHEFNENRYLSETRRQKLSVELGLNEAQIKIWFQNKRAKIKKSSGQKNPLALQLMAQGLYNHSTVPCDEDDMPIDC